MLIPATDESRTNAIWLPEVFSEMPVEFARMAGEKLNHGLGVEVLMQQTGRRRLLAVE